MTSTAPSSTHKNSVLFIICLAASLVPFMGSAVNLALPHIARDFQLNSIGQSWILTSYLLAAAIFQVPFGRLADIWGRRSVFMLGLALFAASTLCCALSFSGTFLLISRIMQGVSSAMIFSTSMAILTAVFPPSERGRAMGINAAVVYLSLALGPSVGGIITQHLGWQSIFTITAAVAVLTLAGSAVVLKQRWAESKGEPFDMRGSIIYGLSLFMLIYGFTILPSLLGFALIAGGGLALMLFIFYERREKYPVFNVKLFFTNRSFSLSSVAALINYASTFPISFLLSLYLQEIKGFDAQHAGLMLIVQPAIQALLSPLAGRLSDRIEPHRLASVGMAAIAVALLAMTFLVNPQTNLAVLIVIQLVLGAGFATFSSPNANAIMGSVEKQHYSMASATTGTMRLVGQAFSMGLTTMVISIFLKHQQVSAATNSAFMQAFSVTFLIFAALCTVGVFFSLARGK